VTRPERRHDTPGTTAIPATVSLSRTGIGFTGHAYAHEERADSFGLQAPAALGVDASRLFTTPTAVAPDDLLTVTAGRLAAIARARRRHRTVTFA
jgi:Cys-tRNA(Pro)/Cys-tRNA(Cys) deacylase